MNLEKAEASAGITLEELAAPEIRAKAPYAIPGEDGLIHRWIFSRVAAVSEQVDRALQDFRFHEASQAIYQFFWGDFCDWYIEWVKPQLAATNRAVAVAAWRNIFAALESALRLLHPVMPFLTEELWHRLPQPEGARSIALDKFPGPRPNWIDPQAEKEFATLQEIITAARNIRAEMKIDQKRKIPADFSSSDSAIRNLAEQNAEPLARLATLSALNISNNRLDGAGAAVRSTSQFDLRIAYGDAIDKDVEIARLQKEIDRLAKDIESKKGRLGDETFLSKAPAKIVEDLKTTLAGREIEHQKLLDRLNQLA
jgi:valyl-tRNA synthetase